MEQQKAWIQNVFLIIFLTTTSVGLAEDVEVIHAKDNIHVLISPKGGNVVVSTGKDGTFLVDDQMTGRSEIIETAARNIKGQDIKFILNTHYHFDHTGGNEFFGNKAAIIVAHDNVRKRLNSDQFITFFKREMPASADAGLPIVTLSSELTLHYNDDEVQLIHAPKAHTDGDTIAYFKNTNVIAAGDLVFNGMYPFIDTEHGGSIRGLLAGLEVILQLANEETLIIPGHGPLMSKADLQTYKSALETIANNIETAISAGKTLKEIMAEKPTAALDTKFRGDIVSADQFVEIVYGSLKTP